MKEMNALFPWREHLPKAAYEATLAEAKERWDLQEPPVNYRWQHVQAVVRLGAALARLTGADEQVVEAAAWLHDVRKMGKDDDHGVEGAKRAGEILALTDFPPGKIDSVAEAIEKHVGLYKDETIEPLEAAVLWDADKLSKLGATSILHAYGYGISMGGETFDQFVEHASGMQWQEKTVQSFNTKFATEAGRKRLAFQRAFWEQLLRELDGGDLKSDP
jgi:uncharacterized protein